MPGHHQQSCRKTGLPHFLLVMALKGSRPEPRGKISHCVHERGQGDLMGLRCSCSVVENNTARRTSHTQFREMLATHQGGERGEATCGEVTAKSKARKEETPGQHTDQYPQAHSQGKMRTTGLRGGQKRRRRSCHIMQLRTGIHCTGLPRYPANKIAERKASLTLSGKHRSWVRDQPVGPEAERGQPEAQP